MDRSGFRIAATILSLGLLASGPAAFAASVDGSSCTVTCLTFAGSAGIKPGLVNGGVLPDVIKVKGTLNGCTVAGAACANLSVVSGAVKGTLNGVANDCLTLIGPNATAGTVTVKWKTTGTDKLLVSSSILTVPGLTGSLFVGFPPAAYGEFAIGGPGVSVAGPFQGPDGGATSTTLNVTSQDFATILGSCLTTKGLTALTLGLGKVSLK